jgi:glutamate-ammonia-ligase adenylyltransferase
MSAHRADWTGALARAEAFSPFLARAMTRQPGLVELLVAGNGEGALAWAKAAGEGAPDPGVALRRERLALALALGIGDLAGAFPLARVMAELSAFADRALDAAIGAAIRQRMPEAEPTGFVALALGKQGAGELNYSSDIDPILLYDPARLPHRPREEPAEAAERIARGVVTTLSEITAEGYVLRVDLRLRPASEISPPALPIAAALSHYESSALAWERAAFIRARPCAGDLEMGTNFLAAIRPFVWRKSLDFGAIAEIGRLTRRIRAHHGQVAVPGPGFDVKRGRGGIREAEFFAQTLQLIHGGRHPALRLRGTRPALDALAVAGIIAGSDAAAIGEAYDRLRVIEHRLQMVQDRQTHALPTDPAALDAVARLDGLADGAALIAELNHCTAAIATRYDRLIEASPAASAPGPSHLADAARIAGWRDGRIRALRSEAALAAFDAVLPQLLAALAAAPEPERALIRWERLLEALPSAINLFRLLEARPGLLELLARILALAPPLADALARRADLLDALIDHSALDLPGSAAELTAEFAAIEPGDDYQHLLDRVRRKVGERRFALGVQLIAGAQDPLDVAAALARVAEAAIRALGEATIAEFAAAHGRVPDSQLVILGLGRLGGGALTHASDLDLVYLFTGEHGAESAGVRPLGATLYYNRLAARISGALSAPTAEGALYEVDTRLRPQGTQGPLAASLDSFARYQREAAWTWEHMALARARVMLGGPEPVAAVIAEVLKTRRDPARLRQDVLDMRAKMAAHKPARGALDVKLMRGGLVDVEFIVHFLQLRDGIALIPDLGIALAELAAAGRVPPALGEAHALLTRLLVASRLLAPDAEVPAPAAREVLASACGSRAWEEVPARLAAARLVVADAWTAAFGEPLEGLE